MYETGVARAQMIFRFREEDVIHFFDEHTKDEKCRHGVFYSLTNESNILYKNSFFRQKTFELDLGAKMDQIKDDIYITGGIRD